MIVYKVLPNGVYGGEVEMPDAEGIPPGYTRAVPPEIPEGYFAVMGAGGWSLSQGVAPEYPSISTEISNAIAANKAMATALLSQTDWTTIPDVADPAKSNPYLSNADEFVAYRNAVRQIAVNPPVVVDAWPVMPQEVWVNVPTE